MAESNDFNAMPLQDFAKTHHASSEARLQPCTCKATGEVYNDLALKQPGITTPEGQQSWLFLSFSTKWTGPKTIAAIKAQLDNLYVVETTSRKEGHRKSFTLFQGAVTEDLW